VQGDKDLKVRFYNIEDALDEKSWIAGIISETFGRKVDNLESLKHPDTTSTISGGSLSLWLPSCEHSYSNLSALLLPTSLII
jgi:hypothetical protein